jgi:tetratricopeptide (TPR) repeat protein
MSSDFPQPRSTQNQRLRPVEEWDSVGRRDEDGMPVDSYDDFNYEESDEDFYEYELTLGDQIRAFGGRILIRVGWGVLAGALAFGGAGIVGAMSRQPTSDNRPELTYDADNELSVRLDTAVRDLALLNDDVQALGDQTRKALASLSQVNQVGLEAAWDAGSNNVNSIESRATALSTRLSCASWNTGLEVRLLESYSPAMIGRYDEVCQAVASVSPLRGDWESLVAGTKRAMRVATDINDHDQVAAAALQLANLGRYPEALDQLETAAASISDATSIASDMARIADVSTLQEWLRRTKDVDDALEILWQAMVDSNGEITIQVTAALKNVNAAKELLPNSNTVMTVALHEMAGGLTSDGISIETAKGNLASALAALVKVPATE